MGGEPGDGAGSVLAWRDLLQRWSDEWLDPVLHEQERAEPFADAVRRARWLGTRGASAPDLDALEERLGVRLPFSYRQFLATTDGWPDTNGFVERILPAGEAGWTRDLDADLVAGWIEGSSGAARVDDADYFVYGQAQNPISIRPEYLPHTLQISHTEDASDVYLLNPCVVTPDGEWEAWYLAHWLPGAVRYRSFWDLMNGEYVRFRGEG